LEEKRLAFETAPEGLHGFPLAGNASAGW